MQSKQTQQPTKKISQQVNLKAQNNLKSPQIFQKNQGQNLGIKHKKTEEQIPLNQNDQNLNQNPTLINFNNLKRSEFETFANEKNFEATH